MSLSIVSHSEIRAHILSGVVLTIRGAQRQGGDQQFIAGVLANAEHNALACSLDWPCILTDAKKILGSGVAALIDQAMTLAPGAMIGPGRLTPLVKRRILGASRLHSR